MQFRTLARTGLLVSEISLGTVEIGLDYGLACNGQAHRPAEQEAARLLHRALDLGVNFMDTARAYGASEEIIGRVLRHRRNDFILCSKAQIHRQGEQLRESITASIHASLQALHTDVIDIMMIHSAPLDVIVRGEAIQILGDLKREGHFRWVGASVYGEDAALAAIRAGTYDCLQVAYSAIDRRPERLALSDIGIVARSVLLKGALTNRYHFLPETLAPLKAAVRRIQAIAEAGGMSLPELCYRYVLSHPIPHTALVGASTVEELESAVRFAEAGPLPKDMIERIREVDIEDENLLNPATWGVA